MLDHLVLVVAAFLAGILNTIAGGGTFLTFPALVYAGKWVSPSHTSTPVIALGDGKPKTSGRWG
jgi:uncharacterized membrane protein YfcA